MHVLHTHPGLADQIKQLEESRDKHAAALAEIDQLLNRISQTLKSLHPSSQLSSPSVTAGWTAMGEGGRRKYHKMELTGDQAVVAFVKKRGIATTAEINAQWRAEGRGGVANNAIVRLLKRGELVRETSQGSRGGRYRHQDEIRRHNLAETAHESAGEGAMPSAANSNDGSHYFSANPQLSQS
jgi:arginine repressor